MYVIKTNGKKQSFYPNKIFNRIKKAAEGLNIKSDELFTDCVQGLVDGMTTEEVDKHIASTAANKMVLHNDYNIFASRILISRHSKKIGIEATKEDYMYDFIGFNSFLYKYSIKNDKKEPIELPHMMYKRVADYLFEEENVLGVTKEVYNDELANRNISVATPQLMNFGTSRKSGISCNITSLISDSKEGILDTLSAASISSSDGAGIGMHIHNLRSRQTLVSSFKGFAGGVIRFCDMLQSHMRFFKQGNRSGSAAVYLGVWHLDIEDFLHLRLQIGEERNRTRDLFTAVCIPDLFYEKLNSGDDDWYLFCPHQVKQAGFEPLYDVYGEKFKERYNSLVKSGIGTKVSLKKIWNMILTSAAEAGLPYVWNWCNANKRNPQSNIGIRRGSNLCIEYYGVSRPNYTSQCNLGLIPLHNLEKNDFKEIARRVKILTVGLNKAIDKTVWSTNDAKAAGEDQRTIGIGIAGLADYMAEHKIVFDSDEALEFNKKLMEVIYKTSKETSSELATKYYNKSYPAWKGSDYEKDNTPMANSLLVCLMPSASTSTLLGVNECFEPFHSNMFLRRLDVGEFVVVNKYLQQELQELRMWNSYIISLILKDEGSVQNIPSIPDDIKQRYRTIFEYKQKNLIDLAVVRQENIDQGQSMNLYFKEATTGKIGGALNYAWKQGLPTGSYYTKTESVLKAPTRLAVSNDLTEKPKDSPFECFNCSA